MGRKKVLIVDTDAEALRGLEASLREEYDVLTAQDPSTALSLAREWRPSVIVVELALPPTPTNPDVGIWMLHVLRAQGCTSKVIVWTALPEREHVIQALGCGLFDVFKKPVDLGMVRYSVQRAIGMWELEQDRRHVPHEVDCATGEMIGTSDGIRQIFSTIRKVATTDYPIFITGESGTGKELTAKAVHERSLRRQGPFIPINCGAIPETLLESELFGHERGAFTGAVQRVAGKVEAAEGGTLFLDEVGDLTLPVQVKLLRFLQERVIERVGGRQSIKLDVRIIAATNVDLKQAIEKGNFREDLYYRLGVVHIHLPPLRDRGEDALLMAMVFLRRVGEEIGKRVTGFTPEAIRAINEYPWPGNIRELANKIRRAVVMTDGSLISVRDLDLPVEIERAGPPMTLVSLDSARRKAERDALVQAMALHQRNLSRVAQGLAVSRPALYRLLRKFGLQEGVSSGQRQRSNRSSRSSGTSPHP